MEYNQYRAIDDFYDSSYNDPEKFYTKGPATEYKWKGKMNHLSPIVAQNLKCFVRWMTHEDRPYELHDDFLATLTRDIYLKFKHMDITENAQKGSLVDCQEDVSYTALTIVCTINVSIDCDCFDVSNPSTRKNIHKRKSSQ